MRNKIVICSNTSWYIYIFRRGLIDALFNKGYEIHIIAPEDDYSKRIRGSLRDLNFIDLKIRILREQIYRRFKIIIKLFIKIINKISPQLS